jgi:chemotaxis protein methyltransferase CheR
MKSEDFDLLANLVRGKSGLVLTPDKSYLIESRLVPVTRKFGMKAIEDIVAAIRLRNDQAVARAVTEAMTTNETLFFRDTKPFEQFKRVVMPNLMKARGSRNSLRIWCAACSSGQEPYSLAMSLKELGAQVAGWKFEIVATDLSAEMIERGKLGIYSQFEVQRGLPIQMLMKYFKQADNDRWQISSELRSMVQFREFNLLEDFRSLGQFDVVFIRNVLIYFDPPTKAVVLNKVAQLMPEDGYLYLGGAETVLGVTDRFEAVSGERGLYKPSAKRLG